MKEIVRDRGNVRVHFSFDPTCSRIQFLLSPIMTPLNFLLKEAFLCQPLEDLLLLSFVIGSNDSSGDVVERGIGEIRLYSISNPHACSQTFISRS